MPTRSEIHNAGRRRETYVAKPNQIQRSWQHVDATDVPLGRLAADIAVVLMGKHRPEYTPHVDTGDYVVVTNASKVTLTGNKATQKLKTRYTGYPGGLKAETFGSVRDQRPEKLIEDAVRRMLPKSRLGRVMIKKLKVYPGDEHPHTSNQPQPMKR
ncbi:MAG: 50S ribosomal protein L13 [Planctomycetota bacterium]